MVQYNEKIFEIFTKDVSDQEASDRAFNFFNFFPLSDWKDTPWWRGDMPATDPVETTTGGLMIALWVSWNPSWWIKVCIWAEAKGYLETKNA